MSSPSPPVLQFILPGQSKGLTLQVLPNTITQPRPCPFQQGGAGAWLGQWQGSLSRLGPGSSVAMAMLRLGLGLSITAFPIKSFSGLWGLNL